MKKEQIKRDQQDKTALLFKCPFCLLSFVRPISSNEHNVPEIYAVCPYCRKGFNYEIDLGRG